MGDAPRVVIAEDDELVSQVLALACRQGGVAVVGRASTFDELLRICRNDTPNVAVVADHLDAVPVEVCLRALDSSTTRVVVLSHDPSPDRLGSLLADDVWGYFSDDASPDEVVNGVRAVARGHVALNPAVTSRIVSQWRRMRMQPIHLGPRRSTRLTPREHDVLCAMAEGLSAKAIATRLGVALKTVENHKIRVFDKLGARTQAQAVTVALAHGLTTTPSPGTRSSEETDA